MAKQALKVPEKFKKFIPIDAQKLNVSKGKMVQGEKTIIKHKEGVVYLVDFWATWCPPCQAPMAHNQQMIEKNKWKPNQVRIIGVSTEFINPEKVCNHVSEKGWTAVEHYVACN